MSAGRAAAAGRGAGEAGCFLVNWQLRVVVELPANVGRDAILFLSTLNGCIGEKCLNCQFSAKNKSREWSMSVCFLFAAHMSHFHGTPKQKLDFLSSIELFPILRNPDPKQRKFLPKTSLLLAGSGVAQKGNPVSVDGFN